MIGDFENRNRITKSLLLVVLMVVSFQMPMIAVGDQSSPFENGTGATPEQKQIQSSDVDTSSTPGLDHMLLPDHPAFHDMLWSDPGILYGQITDTSFLDGGYRFMVEETETEDHDNDGINDLDDLDDDNDGISDLIERFDGCYGTDPFDHDNDGIQDEFDFDDDNDGILEGPIDYSQGTDPWNVTSDRYVEPTVLHPWTGLALGSGYLVDQNPLDHDNDGITDEDIDGPGKGSYDEDDDNDARIDQFVWPCDFDGDGLQDYWDADDDNDGVIDLWDTHPWNASETSNITMTAANWSDAISWASSKTHQVSITSAGFSIADLQIEVGDTVTWTNNDTENHSAVAADGTFDSGSLATGESFSHTFDSEGSWRYSDTIEGGVGDGVISVFAATGAPFPDVFGLDFDTYGKEKLDFAFKEQNLWHPRNPSFSEIVDGDLDGDGLPNFIDPDNDNDGTPDSADTDDDNDGLLDMWDIDDDNDGIPDNCLNVLTDLSQYLDGFSEWFGQIPGVDCEIDYDRDADDDAYRAIDADYDLVWDWKDTDLGAAYPADNLLGNPGVDPADIPYDLDNDGIPNQDDPYPMVPTSTLETWNCETLQNPNPINPDPRCLTERKSHTGNNDWDGDGFSNWEDVDDDNDGVLDWLDIDENCDLDDDNDLHLLNGSRYRDDGLNFIDTDIDGDGLSNDEDWDDDNDGISDLYDPDDGNCGIVDNDNTDQFDNSYSHQDGDTIDGSDDSGLYTGTGTLHWDMFWHFSPFFEDHGFVLPYNGYQDDYTLGPPTIVSNGNVPEMYWHVMMKWSPWNGNNYFDIDMDGDSLINGVDVDMDADGVPNWWDRDEGSDGRYDVNDPAYGGSLDDGECDISMAFLLGLSAGPIACGLALAWLYGFPLADVRSVNNIPFTLPYSSRPDPLYTDGPYAGENSAGINEFTCERNCFHFDFLGNQDAGPSAAVGFDKMINNRDLWTAYVGINNGFFQWVADPNGNLFPDEVADLLDNNVDPDDDCGAPVTGTLNPSCMVNDTADLDDDFDGVYDHWDVDDDNNGIWDFFEIDVNDDLDDDSNTEPLGNFFTGYNCDDHDDDGTDTDPDGDGWYQSVWDRGRLGQGLLFPQYYDVDNDNDGVPDGEDPDDDNNGVLDVEQELICFRGEEQSPWDHDNDGIPDWADTDWDGDGISNTIEQAGGGASHPVAPWDHDNDGLRDDIDPDDDEDGMNDEDEVMLWPTRYGSNSTNPWDHDDYGTGAGMYNPTNASTGPDSLDEDDDTDGIPDVDWDHLEEGAICTDSSGTEYPASDWDNDNDCILDADDKPPTRISLDPIQTVWLDAQFPAVFTGRVDVLNLETGAFVPGADLPVRIVIEYQRNSTETLRTVEVLTDEGGNFTVGQYLYPEDIEVGPSSRYNLRADVIEMFAHDGSSSTPTPLEVRANTTVDYVSWTYFRSDEQPLFVDYKVHYHADWERGIFDNRIKHAPVSFSVAGGPFGNRTVPTLFDGYGFGYRADSNGWVSLTFVQEQGAQGFWKQVRWNSTMDNGVGQPSGGYEEIVWDDNAKIHEVVDRYTYTNTSLPVGDYEFIGFSRPELGDEWPFPQLNGSESETFYIRSMHRMYIEAVMYTTSIRPVYFWDATQFTGSSFGAWRALFHAPSLNSAGIAFEEASLGKPYPLLWDGTTTGLDGEAAKLRPFLSANLTHWSVAMQNGGDFNAPPCGPADPTDPFSPVRCEIIPELFTGESLRVVGEIYNRTFVPWAQDAIALQVDLDQNLVFAGAQETGFARVPNMVDGKAKFDYNWSWYSQYAAGTYGVKADFTNSNFYFTGNQSSILSSTGAYVNVTVIGTSQFLPVEDARLYRGVNRTVEVRLVDNSLQPLREVPVTYSWDADGSNGLTSTDKNGIFRVNLTIGQEHPLGAFTLSYTYSGDMLHQSSEGQTDLWVVSRTYIDLQSSVSGPLMSGQDWYFTAQVTDDNRTAFEKDSGQALDGCGENGGTVTMIMEGLDFEDRVHRKIVDNICPNAGAITHQMTLDPEILTSDAQSFLPDGFGPVNVILRFNENLPHEGCGPLGPDALEIAGAWDECTQDIYNDHYRRVLQFQEEGFYLLGETSMSVDEQVVYTSEADPLTGESIQKPMTVTGQLVDELGRNLSFRNVKVDYEMLGSQLGIRTCLPGTTDINGFFEILCSLEGVQAGQAKVQVRYNSWENADRYRYLNATKTMLFPVYSNSTLQMIEIGPFRNDVDTYTFANGSTFPVLYLKESFHFDARLTQVNGNPVGGKCLNIYLDPETNTRPFATARTNDGTGSVEWFSGDKEDNPSQRGVDPSGDQLEGFRTVRIAYEPTRSVPGGCQIETAPVINGSFVDVEILVQSRVDILLSQQWARPEGYQIGEVVEGSVAILRDRIDLAVEGQTVVFTQYYNNGTGWELFKVYYTTTSEQGVANFSFEYTGEDLPGEQSASLGGPSAVNGEWRIEVEFQGDYRFVSSSLDNTPRIRLADPADLDQQSFFTARVITILSLIAVSTLLLAAYMYRNYIERRRIEILRGILTDSLWALQGRNSYIEIIFNCYKDLVKFFRQRGAMKKVYETTREFEHAVNQMLGGIAPPEDLSEFFSIFEEARYSDHEIGADQRDRAIAALQNIVGHLSKSLGESMLSRIRSEGISMYGTSTKAGTFIDSEGQVRVAGTDDNKDEQVGFKI